MWWTQEEIFRQFVKLLNEVCERQKMLHDRGGESAVMLTLDAARIEGAARVLGISTPDIRRMINLHHPMVVEALIKKLEQSSHLIKV